MAKKPNYNFEKRQKELAKKKKQEEKKQARLERRSQPDGTDPEGKDAEIEGDGE